MIIWHTFKIKLITLVICDEGSGGSSLLTQYLMEKYPSLIEGGRTRNALGRHCAAWVQILPSPLMNETLSLD